MYYAFECECGNILCQAQNEQAFLFRFTIFFSFENFLYTYSWVDIGTTSIHPVLGRSVFKFLVVSSSSLAVIEMQVKLREFSSDANV